MSTITPAQISNMIAKGQFVPHTGLTRMAMAYYQNAANYFARAIFPICPVQLSSDNYYIFDKEDLLRDNWARKPEYGQVTPAVVSEHTESYAVKVDQMIMGVSQIRQTDLLRRQGPGISDPRNQRTKTIAESANIHQDVEFAKNFFSPGAWKNEWTGATAHDDSKKEFIKFSDDNSDPIKFIADRKLEIHEQTGRTPNKLALGAHVFNTLRTHPGIVDRVIHGGNSVNPATVSKKALAELFEVDQVVVQMSIRNNAKQGKEADMSFIGDPDSMLLAYATDAPSVDEPSAGYIFTWDMLGNGQTMPIFHRIKDDATHSEEVEGLMAYAMKKTADDLAMFFKEVI